MAQNSIDTDSLISRINTFNKALEMNRIQQCDLIYEIAALTICNTSPMIIKQKVDNIDILQDVYSLMYAARLNTEKKLNSSKDEFGYQGV